MAARLSAMGAPAVLSGGVTLDQLTINPKDMALLELRQFAESRLAVLLGVPPFLVGLPSGGDSMTYSNVNSIFDYHWRSSLRTKAAAIMEAISQWACPGQRLEVNPTSTCADFKTRADRSKGCSTSSIPRPGAGDDLPEIRLRTG